MAAAARTEPTAQGMAVPWAGAAALLGMLSVPVHAWLLLAHRHSAVVTAVLLLMTLLCLGCALRTARCRGLHQDAGLRGLLLMADAMVLAHAILLLPGAGHGPHGGHHPGAAALAAAAPAGAAMLALIGLELAVAMCAALALRARRLTADI